MGRIFKLSPGLTMKLAYAVLMALLLSLSWFIVSQYTRPYWTRVLMVIAIMAGGLIGRINALFTHVQQLLTVVGSLGTPAMHPGNRLTGRQRR
jgi:ribose/xylose/arabinose/galactoside ABC-type transport system permease subunit